MPPTKKLPRKLNYKKCDRCRRDKAACTPKERSWPGTRCDRCEKYDYPCSENKDMRGRALRLRRFLKNTEEGTQNKETGPTRLLETTVEGDTQNQGMGPLRITEDMPNQTIAHSMFLEGAEDIGNPVGSERLGSVAKCLDMISYLGQSVLDLDDFSGVYLSGQSVSTADKRRAESARILKNRIQILYSEVVNEACSLAEDLTAQGQTWPAEALYQRILAYHEIDHYIAEMREHYNITRIMEKLVDLFETRGDFTPAEELQQRLIKDYERICNHRKCEPTALDRYREKLIQLHKKSTTRLSAITDIYKNGICKYEAGEGLLKCIFLGASYRGGMISVERFLATRSVTATSQVGKDALLAAAYGGSEEVLSALFESCTDISLWKSSDRGGKALHAAVERGHQRVVKFLLNQRVDVNFRDHHLPLLERTSLQIAAEEGQYSMVDLLLDHGANVNAPSGKYRKTALQAAAEKGHYKVVKLLLDHEANVNAPPSKYGRTAIQAAAERGHYEVVKLLLDHEANVNAPPSEYGSTAIQAAAKGGHYKVVKLLLDHEANVNAPPSEDGSTAIQAAAEGGHYEVVKLLIENHADVNAKYARFSRTALGYCILRNRIGILELLLDNGASIDIKTDSDGKTAIELAEWVLKRNNNDTSSQTILQRLKTHQALQHDRIANNIGILTLQETQTVMNLVSIGPLENWFA